eukprot:135579-Alexandrium_andersonii.AAC.1
MHAEVMSDGLDRSHLAFLSGYEPNPAPIRVVGKLASRTQSKAASALGSGALHGTLGPAWTPDSAFPQGCCLGEASGRSHSQSQAWRRLVNPEGWRCRQGLDWWPRRHATNSSGRERARSARALTGL